MYFMMAQGNVVNKRTFKNGSFNFIEQNNVKNLETCPTRKINLSNCLSTNNVISLSISRKK